MVKRGETQQQWWKNGMVVCVSFLKNENNKISNYHYKLTEENLEKKKKKNYKENTHNAATHSSVLAWRVPWTEELGGLQSVGL